MITYHYQLFCLQSRLVTLAEHLLTSSMMTTSKALNFFGKIAASSLNTGDADDVSIVQVNSPQLVVVLL